MFSLVELEKGYITLRPGLNRNTLYHNAFCFFFRFTSVILCFFFKTFFSLEFADSAVQNTLVNVFALGSRLGLAAGWTAMAVMTVEIYPTVIR